MIVLTIICMHCKKKMGEKDGEGAEGNSHSICKACWEERYPQWPYLGEGKEQRSQDVKKR